MGDLALSRLLEGLQSSSLFAVRADRGGETGELLEAADTPAAAAFKRCWRRPGLRPKRCPVKGASKLGVGGFMRPARGSLNPGGAPAGEVVVLAGLVDPEVVVGAAGGPPAPVAAAAAAAAKSGLNIYSQCCK